MKYKTKLVLVALTLVFTSSHHLNAAVLNHWKFDETTGIVAADSAGSNANNATWQEAASAGLTWNPSGMIGGAAQLSGENGVDRNFVISNAGGASIELENSTALTISVWVQPNLTQNSTATGIFNTRTSVIQRGTTSFSNQFWGLGWESVNTNGRRVRADSTGATRSGELYDGTEATPEWFHIAFTWEGDGADVPAAANDDPTAVYVNGVLDVNAVVNADLYVSGGWRIGGDPLANANRNFGGLIDDLAVWDVVLSESDIMTIYDGGLMGVDAVTALRGDAVLGDVTGEGDVNDDDFQIIRQNFFQPFADLNQGDLFDNDFIDFRDYAEWKQAVKTGGAFSAPGAAPEPSCLGLVVGAAVVALLGRRSTKPC